MRLLITPDGWWSVGETMMDNNRQLWTITDNDGQ
jgi:hypothetical protein